MHTFVTAAIKVNSDIGCSVLLENFKDMVITEGFEESLVASNEMLSFVSLTESVFEDGKPSGSADENAQSSSSAAGGPAAGGFGFTKSNMEDCGC